MHSRSRLLVALTVGLVATACASGTGTTTDTQPAPSNGVPERTFPPGTEPSRNVWTRSAQIYLDQAERTDAADQKRAEYTQALEQARLSIQNEPNNALGYYQAGIALIGLGQYEEAGQMLDRAEEIYPRYVVETAPRRQNAWISLYNSAVQALQQNDEDLAVETMLLADRVYQDRPEARVNLGIIYTNRGEYERALEWYGRALETLRSDDVQFMTPEVQANWAEQESTVIFNMAQVYQRMNQPADAIRLYREYVAEHPEDAAVKVHLALALSAAGEEAEAGALFSEVLNMEGLSEEEYYQIGIGLFNAGRFDDAVTAFERAVAANPHFRDAVFNLSQALLAQANALREEGAGDAELQPLYERLVQIGTALREIDPFSRIAGIVLASSYRSLADITTGAAATQWRNRLASLLQEVGELPFDVTNVAMRQVGPGRIEISGSVENLALNPGAPIGLRFTIVGPTGAALGTQDVTVAAPAREESTSFRTVVEVQGEIAGWRYERID